MSEIMTVRGVPAGLALDGWWLSAEVEPPADIPADTAQRNSSDTLWRDRARRRIALLLGLLALADILFFGRGLGVSVAVFVGAVFAASVIEARDRTVLLGPVAVLVLGVLPVLEYVQTTSLLFAFAGLLVSVVWHRIGTVEDLTIGLRRMMVWFPLAPFRSLSDWQKAPSGDVDVHEVLRGFVRNWAIPLGGGALILSLLISANPVLERWMTTLWDVEFDVARFLTRLLFWGGIALLVWPFLSANGVQLAAPSGQARMRRVWRFGLNAQSVSNALMVFNGLLALQLVLDGQFFWGGGALPEGITYAKYAHRGAYPLLVTALLAGAFALAARPFLDEGRYLKPLMMVWLGLNVLLTLSSMYRLGIYVEAYGLTYLRIRAGIWMVLVAIWLGLIGWQIWAAKANGWLVLRSFGLSAVVLYLGCFVNFAHVIAAHNVGHERGAGYYMCQLDDTASGALWGKDFGYRCAVEGPKIDGWRDWGFREWRVARYIGAIEAREVGREDFGG